MITFVVPTTMTTNLKVRILIGFLLEWYRVHYVVVLIATAALSLNRKGRKFVVGMSVMADICLAILRQLCCT